MIKEIGATYSQNGGEMAFWLEWWLIIWYANWIKRWFHEPWDEIFLPSACKWSTVLLSMWCTFISYTHCLIVSYAERWAKRLRRLGQCGNQCQDKHGHVLRLLGWLNYGLFVTLTQCLNCLSVSLQNVYFVWIYVCRASIKESRHWRTEIVDFVQWNPRPFFKHLSNINKPTAIL